jgi:hypothetical protein
MHNLTKYVLDDDDILFFIEIEDVCINGQNEIILECGGLFKNNIALQKHY